MLPPDDDYLEDSFGGPDSAPDEAEFNAALALIPVDFYEQLAPLLQLCAVANFLLLGRPADPVPQAIEQLTGFDVSAARQVSRLRDSAELGRLLLRRPELLHDYIIVGQLTFSSPLFAAVRRLLPAPVGPEGEVADCLRDFVVEFSEDIISNLTEYVAVSAAGRVPDLHLRRLQLESIFARLEDTLVPARLPGAEEPAGRPAAASSGRAVLRISFPAAQHAALLLALTLPTQLATGTFNQRFTAAVLALPGLQSASALRQRLAALRSGEAIDLALDDLRLLYEAAQVCALALVSGSFDDSDLLAGLLPTAAPGALCAELEQFVQLVQATFPDEPRLAAARHEAETLAELL